MLKKLSFLYKSLVLQQRNLEIADYVRMTTQSAGAALLFCIKVVQLINAYECSNVLSNSGNWVSLASES